MKKVEIIDNSVNIKCTTCNTNGTCNTCNGTKIYKRDRYIIVADNGKQKIAFDVDNPGK